MIINSKYKDYYDFLQGVIGRDNNLILDRMGHSATSHEYEFIDLYQSKNPCLVSVVIGTNSYRYLMFKGKVYNSRTEIDFFDGMTTHFTEEKQPYFNLYNSFGKETKVICPNLGKNLLEPNDILKMPTQEGKDRPFIYASIRDLSNGTTTSINYPILDNLKFGKVLDPYTIWSLIYDELCKKKDAVIAEPQTDKEKIESKGFDNKTSFRNIK